MRASEFVVAAILLAFLAPGRTATLRAADADAAGDQRIAKLIEQLGDTQYAVRQRAQQELIKLGFEAFDALSDAENSDDPEIAMQAAYLVRMIRVDWTRDTDPRQVQTILKDYESQNDEARLLKIKQLAELPGDLGLEWLCRLVRFERSPVLSKQAALAIMASGDELDEADWARRTEVISKSLRRGRRPGAAWLEVYVQSHGDPAGALAQWGVLVSTERQVLEHHPQESSSHLVMKLLRRQVDLLDRLGRESDTPALLHEMVLCERGDSASLGELIEWLAGRKAWNVVDEVATRFAASFDIDPVLMYTLCEVRLAQGNKELAEQTAEKALQLSGDKPLEHMGVAARLMDRGLTAGSDRELRYIIKLGPLTSMAAVNARRYLSESLHDRALDLEAGQVLKELLDAADKEAAVEAEIRRLLQQSEKNPNLLRARMYYYLACHAAEEHDTARQRELLDKAIEQDSSDVDVLIALHRLTRDDPPARANIMTLVRKVVDESRKDIDDAPDDPTAYNQVAWMIANTEGDIDEAIRLSHRSVELARAAATGPSEVRRIGGLLDTLAHCYFSKQDYANAVKYQTEAEKLDPHTKAIGRQLKVFRDTLARQPSQSK